METKLGILGNLVIWTKNWHRDPFDTIEGYSYYLDSYENFKTLLVGQPDSVRHTGKCIAKDDYTNV